MYKVILSFVFLVSSLGTAQMQIGIINPEEAMLQFQEYKQADARFNQFIQSKEKELEKFREKVVEMENKANNYTGDKSSEDFMLLVQNYRSYYQNYELWVNDYNREKNKREQELLVPLKSRFYASIEQIALEEGMSLVLHTDRISDELIKIIGKNNFIDITELVIERANEN